MTKIILLLISAAFFVAAGYSLKKGIIYCKGCTYSRAGEPLGFWASVAVFVAFGIMLVYFGLK